MDLSNSSICFSFLPHSADSMTWVTNDDRSALQPISASVIYLVEVFGLNYDVS